MASAVEGQRPQRVGALSIHPAPYRDPTFTAVHRRGLIDLQVLTLFEQDEGHPYWGLSQPDYPNRFLGRSYRLRQGVDWHPRILSVLRGERFDVVVVPGYNHITCQVAILYCIATGTPLVFNTDGVLFTPHSTIRRPSRDRLVRFILGHAAAVWVPGEASCDYMRHYRFAPDRVFQGSYCLDVDAIARRLDRAGADGPETPWIRSENEFVFVMAANAIPERQPATLLSAFALARARSHIGLVLAGAGWEPFVEEASLASDVSGIRVLGPVAFDELGAVHTASDAYVHVGIETYSTALCYAAVVGRPIVSTDTLGATVDYVIDGVSGFVVPGGDVEALADAMVRLASNPPRAREMGKRAREIALGRSTDWAAAQLEAAVMAAAGRDGD